MIAIQPRSLLSGASGQIGGQMLHLLGLNRCLVTSRKSESDAALQLYLASIATKADVQGVLDGYSLDAIFCIGGMTNVDGCEATPELAFHTDCCSRGVA